jgi:hypothetical protein
MRTFDDWKSTDTLGDDNEALQLPVSATPEAHEHIATLWAGVPEPPSAAEVDAWEAFYARLERG